MNNIPLGRVVLAVCAGTLLMYLVFAAAWGLDFGWRWATAGPSGQLEAREEILSGPNRIAAYNHFFNLCASIQGNEVQLEALNAQLGQASPDDRDRVLSSIAGVTAARGSAIAQYNADAGKDYTIGQFRDLDLPYQLMATPYEGGRTQCASQ